jgi:DUF1680 family protein
MGRTAIIAALTALPALAQGVLDLSKSPYAKLHPVPVKAVKLSGGFWEPRRRVNVEKSIPTMLQLMEEHGIVDNFRRLSGAKPGVPRKGPLYTDSDLYKWMEAAAFVLQSEDRPDLRATLDRITADVIGAQEASGYLNTYYVEDRVKLRFTEMTRSHELYCLGHLLQAAIARYRADGDRKLLDAGIRYVNYLNADFGPAPKRPLLTGHPELELALVELYRVTGTKAYLDLAGYLLSGVEQDRLKLRDSDIRYMFSGKPFTSRTEFEGHAVRAMYAASGAADYYMETGNPDYRTTLDRLWTDLSGRKMYITGGVGSRESGEAFGAPYELPNESAYTESCAAIGNMFFNERMLSATADSKYTDVIERALYNGVNSGMSIDGTLYCYRNPLSSTGEKIRNPWYDTTCCPPNIERVLASLPGYFYSTSRDGLYVHLYDNGELSWKLEDGTPIRVRQQTKYPWDGSVTLTVSPKEATEFTLFVRIPEWSRTSRVTWPGSSDSPAAGRYLPIRRTWKPGDVVQLRFDFKPELIVSNPRVPENWGKVAVQRGPLVYCLEQQDQPDERSPFDLQLALTTKPFTEDSRPELLGGIVTLRHPGVAASKPTTEQPLYSRAQERAAASTPADLVFIPYYAWANRGPSNMEVWVRLASGAAAPAR